MTGKPATDHNKLLQKQQGVSVHFDLGNAGRLNLPLINLSLIQTPLHIIDL